MLPSCSQSGVELDRTASQFSFIRTWTECEVVTIWCFSYLLTGNSGLGPETLFGHAVYDISMILMMPQTHPSETLEGGLPSDYPQRKPLPLPGTRI